MEIYQQLRREQFSEILKQCVFTKEIGTSDGELLVHKTSKTKLLLQTRTFNDQLSVQKLREEAALRLMIVDPSIDRLVAFNSKQVSSFCGSVYRIQLLHEFTSVTLEDVIKHNRKHNRPFPESELLQIARDVLGSLITMNQASIRHGYVQPKYIYQHQRDRYKLCDVRFRLGMFEYKQQMLGFQEECYLAPELFTELGKRTLNPLYNYEKSEVFSLGLCLLTCCQLEHIAVHDFNTFEIMNDRLQAALKSIDITYGRRISTLIAGMLHLDESKRFSFSELQTHIVPLQSTPAKSKSPMVIKTLEKPTYNLLDNLTSIKKAEITPVSYTSLEPVQTQMEASVVHWEREHSEFSTIALDNQLSALKLDMKHRQQQHDFTHRAPRLNWERQTKPCPSPLSKVRSQVASEVGTQRSIDLSRLSSYDFIEDIKIDAPTSLMSEFSRLDFKLKPQFNYDTLNPHFQRDTSHKTIYLS